MHTLSYGDIHEHASYVADARRLEAYETALTRVLRPGAVVLDLGAGTGVLGLLALRIGARRLYVVDEGPLLELARALHRGNGSGDEVRFLPGRSTRLDLPELVDVVVADQAAWFGFGAGLLESFEDAARRFLRPDGVLVPHALAIDVALLEDPDLRAEVAVWSAGSPGPDLGAGRAVAVGTGPWPRRPGRDDLLTDPTPGVTLDLRASGSRGLRIETEVRAVRAGSVDAIGGWFVAHLAPGVTMTNAPWAKDCIDRPMGVLPIDPPLPVAAGDSVRLAVDYHPRSRFCAWEVEGLEGPGRAVGDMRVRRHSTLDASLVSKAALARLRPTHVPVLSARGQAVRRALELCDGAHSLTDVRATLRAEYPTLLRTEEDCADFLQGLLEAYEH